MEERNERDIELLGMWRAEYTRAKSFVYWGYSLEFIAAITGILVIRLVPDIYGVWASPLVAGLAATGYFLKRHYDTIRSYAEEARRVGVLMKGVDYRISEKKRGELEKPFSSNAKKIAKQKLDENRSYFATTNNYGHLKVLNMLQESAFYTHSLLEKAAKYAGFMSIFLTILVFLALYFMAFVTTGPKQNWASDIFIASVLGFLTSGMWLLHNKYKEIGTRIKHIDDELDAMREAKSELTLLNVFAKLNEYDCLLMEAPVVPDFIHMWNHDKLDSEWKRRQKEYQYCFGANG